MVPGATGTFVPLAVGCRGESRDELPTCRDWTQRWQARCGLCSTGKEQVPSVTCGPKSVSRGRDRGWAGVGWEGSWEGSCCHRPKNNTAEQETRRDGAKLAEREVVFFFNGFLL